MRYSILSAALVGLATAFPAIVRDAVAAEPEKYAALAKEKRVNGIDPGFDASKQYISTTGQYKWVAPGPSDQRGVCPGLNAFANHNYIPHDGIATIQQFIDATTSVVGMGDDLAAFLAIYGAIFDGDLTKWSIGGPDSRVGVPALESTGLVGTPEGISGSHNKYEADVSPTRGDLYQYGNDYLVQLKQFTAFYATQASVAESKRNYDIGVQTNYRIQRFQDSISQNPYFFNNFFSGILVQPAAYTFQYRFMANHSTEYPEGRLGGEVLKSWFGITGDYPNFKHTAGYERIPDNWYRRAFGDEYTIPFFLEDVVAMGLPNPQFFDFGGNTNGVNTFTGLDLVNLTAGAYNAKDFSNPQTLACFVYQSLVQQTPDLLLPAARLSLKAFSMLQEAGGHLVANFNCPKLNKIQQGQFTQANMAKAAQKFPGFAKLNQKTGTY